VQIPGVSGGSAEAMIGLTLNILQFKRCGRPHNENLYSLDKVHLIAINENKGNIKLTNLTINNAVI